jgi:hypothetical protein
VQKSGKPEVATLWTKPEEDKAFMDAVKHNRVLTVAQRLKSNKKDVGEVGFHPQPLAAYLVFPRRTAEKDGIRVVGIHYELLQPGPVNKEEKPKIAKAKALAPATPKETGFQTTVSRTVKQEFIYDIKSSNAAGAKKAALDRLKTQEIPQNSNVLSIKVSSLRRKD